MVSDILLVSEGLLKHKIHVKIGTTLQTPNNVKKAKKLIYKRVWKIIMEQVRDMQEYCK